MSREEIISYFVHSADNEEQKELMVDVLNFVLDQRIKNFYISSLYRHLKEKYSREDLLKFIQKLLFGRYKILDVAYDFFDEDDNDKRYPISKQEFKEFESEKLFIHPKTGYELPYDVFLKNTLLYFVPKHEKIREVLSS